MNIPFFNIGKTPEKKRNKIIVFANQKGGCGKTGSVGKRWGLGIQFSESKKKETFICDSSKISPEEFNLSIKRLCRSIG